MKEMEGHIFWRRYIEGTTEIEMFLRRVDPFTKACLPTFYNTYVNTDMYNDTMNDWNRIVYNVVYRFVDVWQLSFEINDTAEKSVGHRESDGVVSELQAFMDVVFWFKKLGQQLGTMFKYVWSSRVVGNRNKELYQYPESALVIEQPQFDELVFPGYNYDLYPKFENY